MVEERIEIKGKSAEGSRLVLLRSFDSVANVLVHALRPVPFGTSLVIEIFVDPADIVLASLALMPDRDRQALAVRLLSLISAIPSPKPETPNP